MHRLLWVLPLAAASCATAVRPLPAPAAAIAPSAPPSRREVVKQLMPSNVRLFVLENGKAKRTASGVVIGAEATLGGAVSYVVTNAHVIDATGLKNPSLTVVVDDGPDSREFNAEPVALGRVPEMDLALIRIRGVSLAPAPIASDDELALGDDVIVVAAPFGRSLSLSGGMVSQLEWDPKARTPRMLKTDAPIGYGSSGGGVYSLATGRLLAIVEGYRTAKVGFAVEKQDYSIDVPMPGETFAAPTAKLRAFLKTSGFERLLESSPDEKVARYGASSIH